MNDNTTATVDLVREAVWMLTREHEEKVWSGESIRSVTHEALLKQLFDAMHGDLGSTGPGRSVSADTRSLLDLGAYEIWEDITGRIEAFHRHLTGKPRRDTPMETLDAWFVAYRADAMVGKYPEQHQRRTLAQLRKFATRIRSHIDPPRVKEIIGACPVETCGLSNVKGPEGDTKTALYATYKQGEQPMVKCRSCGAEWYGERTLLELGYYLQANVDEIALREMGVLRDAS